MRRQGKDTGCKCNQSPVKNKKFPNTVKAVVYEPFQFSPVLDGTINSCKVTQQTIDCVNRALEGEDYSAAPCTS